ncbi:pentapeptide repeat-containing protein [Brachyspira pilosicoli]|uniref:pentapeptide repeat-containing protein n=1 Tax=Brachyspira pilosicoli TaxID=52584 RepID=UPI00300412A9
MAIFEIRDIRATQDILKLTEYTSEEQLIKVFIVYLYQQYLSKRQGICLNYKDNDIITILPEEDYILHIGHQHRETIINFKFDIRSIIYKLNKEAHDTNCEVVNFKLYFQNIYFTKDLVLENITFNNEVYFENCTFNGNVSFTNSIFKENFKFASNTISKKVIFSNIEIFKKAYFLETKEIKNDDYLNVNENGEIEIIKVIENKKLQIVFDNLVFKDNDSNLYIDNGDYKKSFKVSFQNINIKGKIELRNMEIEEADFKGSIIDGGLINPVNFKVNKFANRESALFLKQQAYARNNAIDALQYKAKEIECHKNDLIKDWQNNKDFKTFGDIVSIGLSSLYSDNGQNWIRALGMTIFITAFCFTVFYMPDVFYIDKIFNRENYISLYFCSYQNWFSELVKYFIPTDYILITKYAASNLNLLLKIFGVLVYFLGKVLFWYGSVQTVSAFRKFSKGA